MALADPQTVTINSIAQTLARVSSSENAGVFRKDDGAYKLSVNHAYSSSRIRHLIRLDQAKTAADVYQPAVNSISKMSVHMVVDVPLVGFTIVQQKYDVDGFIAALSASSGALITKILGGEG
jgi:hypothetical protein